MAATMIRIALISLMVILTAGPASAQQRVRNAVNRAVNNAVGNAMRRVANAVPGAAAQNNGAQGGIASGVMMLPAVSTSSVDLNTCDMDFIGGRSRPSSGGGSGGGRADLPGGHPDVRQEADLPGALEVDPLRLKPQPDLLTAIGCSASRCTRGNSSSNWPFSIRFG